jgi:PAS domain-containing protein
MREELADAAELAAGWEHEVEFADAAAVLNKCAESASIQDLEWAMTAMARMLPHLTVFKAARLAQVCATCVRYGAPIRDIMTPFFDRLHHALVQSTDLARLWTTVAADEPFPQPNDLAGIRTTYQQITSAAAAEDALEMTMAWYSLDIMLEAAVVILLDRNVRASLNTRRAELFTAVCEIADVRPDVDFLAKILRLQDNDVHIVLHRPSRQGFRAHLSGIPDNFQLHTILASALVPLLSPHDPAADRPNERQVLAATTGMPVAPMRAYFSMTDSEGNDIPHDGSPNDIPLCGGARVLVLDTPRVIHTWDVGRRFDHLLPQMQIWPLTKEDREMWWRCIAPGPERESHVGT